MMPSNVIQNFWNIFVSKFGVPVFLSSWLAISFHLIIAVVLVGSKPQVDRITTNRVVTTMENLERGFLNSKGCEKNLSMDVFHFSASNEDAISSDGSISHPLPTSIRTFYDLVLKPFQNLTPRFHVMPPNEPFRDCSNISIPFGVALWYSRPLPASAVTKSVGCDSGRVRHIGAFFTELLSGICERPTHLFRDQFSTVFGQNQA